MKLMICIVNNFYTPEIEKEMNKKGYRMTELSSSGGFLKRGSTTFLFGVQTEELATLKEDLKNTCISFEEKKGKRADAPRRFTSFVLSAEDAAFFTQGSPS